MDHNDNDKKKQEHEQGSDHKKEEGTVKILDEKNLEQDQQDQEQKKHDEGADKIGNF